MRPRVEKAAKELGSPPNALASSLTTGLTRLIGLVSNKFHNPIFLEVSNLFTRGLQERGLRPALVNRSDETDPASSVRMLKLYSVDGVVVASSTLPLAFSQAFEEPGVPVVISASIDLVATMLKDTQRRPEAMLFPSTLVERGTLRPR